MRKDEILAKDGVLYIYDDFEDAVFKFTGTGEGNYCTVKFSFGRPYQIKCTTNLAFEAYLGGKVITKEEFDQH